MRPAHDIVIAGAGMVGLATGALLAQCAERDRLKITIVDGGARPAFEPGSDVALRVSAIAPGSVDILRRCGAWDAIAAARVSPYRDMRVWDAGGSADGPETLRFEAAEFALPELGFIAENVLVQSELVTVLDALDIDLRFETRIEAVEPEQRRYRVQLASGDVLEPQLLVAADGARSFVRDQAGIGVRCWPHDQTAFVTHVRPELAHRETAWQRFLPDGPIGLLPLLDGRVSLVWSTTNAVAERALAFSDEELGKVLTEVTDRVLGDLAAAGPRGAFPLGSQLAACYALPGLALVGDAAHAIHPLAGQGANLGLADADCLAGVVCEALASGDYPGDLPVLRRYERARKGANRVALEFMMGLNRLFSNDSRLLARLRGAGMYLFNHSGPVRERAVRQALGIRRL